MEEAIMLDFKSRKPKKMFRRMSALGSVFVLAVPLVLISLPASAATVKNLNWGLAYGPRTLFAPTNYSDVGNEVMSLIQGQILTTNPDGSIVPSVASSWKKVSETEYAYTIKKGIKFSDGSLLTIADVVYSLKMHLDPTVASQEAALLSNVQSITSSGDVMTVKLKTADSMWKYLPATLVGFVWKKAHVEANLANYGTPKVLPIGSGPYKVKEYTPDSRLILVRNKFYTGPKTQFDQITFRVIPDAQTLQLAMIGGQIDGTFSVPSASFLQWKSVFSVTPVSNLVFRGLTLDMTQAPFDDIHVRRALYYATNSSAIVTGLTPGLGRPSTTINDPNIFKGVLDAATIKAGYSSIATYPFSIEKAKAELALSSVPNGFETTMNVPADSATIGKISQVLVQDFAKIGVTLKLNSMPGGPRFQVILDHAPNLGIQIIGNKPDGPDPTQMAFLYFHSSQAAVNGNNSSNYRNPKVDALIEKAQQAKDVKVGAKLVLEAQTLAAQDIPIIPILWGDSAIAVKDSWSAIAPGAFFDTSLWVNLIKTN
ncbi:MAG: hypothetical protein F2845_05865 [Actinobacteria bacterium]|nr:hypothetical protein [Actinomycetota bacterium]MSW26343.1 hypothetical protein [Actinomycetota bacterium]MSW34494.1 hypothetical protein [Actinomycetota bacterium]MSX31330.1 hypothetical protein [Actinomycetota bacterium]MSX51698.1 hypothetical protein [Actinomycetota bacterium]